MAYTVQQLKVLIAQPVNNNISQANARQIFLDLRESAGLFPLLRPHEYSGALTLALIYGKIGGLYDETFQFIDNQYPIYSNIVEYDYLNKSTVFFQWASLLDAMGLNHISLQKTRKGVYYNLLDNVSYSDYEFLSFRGCTKYVLSEIADETLSLMHPSTFNDPLDTVLFRWIENQKVANSALAENNLEALKNLRVRCFSRTARLPRGEKPEELLRLRKHKKQNPCYVSPLMWAHYANEHKGICIRYKFTSAQLPLNNDEKTEMFRFGNIDYKDKFSVNNLDISVSDALFAKSKVWKYEHETRLVYYSTENVNKVKTVPVPGAIQAIDLGMRCSDEDERIIKSLTKGREIPIYRMYTDNSNVYRLTAKRSS